MSLAITHMSLSFVSLIERRHQRTSPSVSRLFSLKENGTGQWRNSDLSLCGTDVCFNGLTNNYDKYILSFGEDQDGTLRHLYNSFKNDSIKFHI